MVAADDDRRRYLACGNEIVDRDAELRAVGLSEPANSRREALKFYLLLRQRDPAFEMLVVREQLECQRIRSRDVVRIAGQCNPAERPLPFTEQRPNVLGHEAWDVKCVLQPRVERDSAN